MMTITERTQRIIERYENDLEGLPFEGPYTTSGSTRGSCGHHHQSLETAARCLARDQAGCESQGGYSDRRIVAVNRDQRGQ